MKITKVCLMRVEIRKKNSLGFCLVCDHCAKAWVVARSLLIAESESPSSNPVGYEKETNPLVFGRGQLFMEFLALAGNSLWRGVTIRGGLGLC